MVGADGIFFSLGVGVGVGVGSAVGVFMVKVPDPAEVNKSVPMPSLARTLAPLIVTLAFPAALALKTMPITVPDEPV